MALILLWFVMFWTTCATHLWKQPSRIWWGLYFLIHICICNCPFCQPEYIHICICPYLSARIYFIFIFVSDMETKYIWIFFFLVYKLQCLWVTVESGMFPPPVTPEWERLETFNWKEFSLLIKKSFQSKKCFLKNQPKKNCLTKKICVFW